MYLRTSETTPTQFKVHDQLRLVRYTRLINTCPDNPLINLRALSFQVGQIITFVTKNADLIHEKKVSFVGLTLIIKRIQKVNQATYIGSDYDAVNTTSVSAKDELKFNLNNSPNRLSWS